MVVQTFRPERVQSSLNDFVCHNLGVPSVSGQTFNFATVAEEELNSRTQISKFAKHSSSTFISASWPS